MSLEGAKQLTVRQMRRGEFSPIRHIYLYQVSIQTLSQALASYGTIAELKYFGVSSSPHLEKLFSRRISAIECVETNAIVIEVAAAPVRIEASICQSQKSDLRLVY